MKISYNLETKWLGSFYVSISTTTILFLANTFYTKHVNKVLLSDSFHNGEHFAALMTLLKSKFVANPLTIHGALDYIPGMIALNLSGENTYFFQTWLIYKFLDFVSKIVFVAIIYNLINNKQLNYIVMIGASILCVFFVGRKDFVLLLITFVFFAVQKADKRILRFMFEASLGFLIAIGMYWSFDRGIAGVVSVGTACIVYAYKDRRFTISLIVFCVTIFFLNYAANITSLSNYLENVIFLMKTSSNWSYGWNENTIVLTAILALSNFFVLWSLWSSIIKSEKITEHFANALFLTVLSLFFFKIGSNRADIPHFLSGLWVPLLTGIYLLSLNILDKHNFLFKSFILIIWFSFLNLGFKFKTFPLLSIFCVLTAWGIYSLSGIRYEVLKGLIYKSMLAIPICVSLLMISKATARGGFRWVDYLISPPTNSEVVTDGIRWVSRELIKTDSECVFDLSNNGVINGLTGLPACTKFTYLVYADQQYEEEIISALRQRRPNAIVSSSTLWSFNIDGKSMQERFPMLERFVLEYYSREKCASDYCVRYLTKGD